MAQPGHPANVLPNRLLPRLNQILGNSDQIPAGLGAHNSGRAILYELDKALTSYHQARGRNYVGPFRPFGQIVVPPLPPNAEALNASLDTQFKASTTGYRPPILTAPAPPPITSSYIEAAKIIIGAANSNPNRVYKQAEVLSVGRYDPFAVAIIATSSRLSRLLHYYVLSNENMVETTTSVVSLLNILDEAEGIGLTVQSQIETRNPNLRSTIEFIENGLSGASRLNAASKALVRASTRFPTLLAIFLDMQSTTLLARMSVVLRILSRGDLQIHLRVILGRRRKTQQYVSGQAGTATSSIPRDQFEEIVRTERRRQRGEDAAPSKRVFDSVEQYQAAYTKLFTTAARNNGGTGFATLEEVIAADGILDEVQIRNIRLTADTFSIVAMKDKLTTALQNIFLNSGEYYDTDYDAMVIESVGFTESDHNTLTLTRLTDYLPDQVSRYLQFLRAYRNSADVLRATAKVQLPGIPFTGKERECVLEAFFSMRILQQQWHGWDFKPYQQRKKELNDAVMQFKTSYQHIIDGYNPSSLSLYKWLEILLGSEVSETLIEPGVMVIMYSGIGRQLFCPMMWIRMVNLRLVIDFPMDEAEHFSDREFPSHQLCLVYYKAHLFVSSLGLIRASIPLSGSSKERVRQLAEQGGAQQYILAPKNVQQLMPKAAKREVKRKKSVEAGGPFATIQGSFDVFSGTDNLSYDLETDNCLSCTRIKGKSVQHAYVMSVAGNGWARTFAGKECELEYGAVEGGMSRYGGCISQALTYLKSSMGFFEIEGDRRPTRAVVTRMLWAFNGASFDAHLILKALNGWRQTVELIDMSGEIIALSWGNYKFVDFRKIYDGSLDKVYNSFTTLEGAGTNRPEQSKLKCFPYALIHKHMDNEWVIGRALEDDKIWGGRRATVFNEETKKDEDFMPELSLGKANAKWWTLHMDERGYRSSHLLYYCELDTVILQWCVDLHVQVLCKGELNGRQYNLNGKMTGPAGALCLLEQCFMEDGHELPAPPQNLRLPGLVENSTNEEVLLSTILRGAMKGGLVDVYCTHMSNPAEIELWKEYKERTGREHTLEGYDVNSMYPFIMNSSPLPFIYKGYENLLENNILLEGDDSQLQGGLQDSDLYLCWINHNGEGTTMIRTAGVCFCPNYIPSSWQDETRKVNGKATTEFNFIYGVELKGVLARGGMIGISYIIHFEVSCIVMNFVKEIYARRVAAKTKMMNLFWKKMLNSLYGKFGQEVKEECHILENLLDVIPLLSENRIMTQFSFLECANDGYDRVMVKIIDKTKASSGQHCAVAGRITAGAREYLRSLQETMSKLPNQIGKPATLYYGDTDSFYIDALVPKEERQPGDATSLFWEEYISDSVLGKLKLETAGITEAHFKAKKTYMLEQEGTNGLINRTIKAKGVNREFVDWMQMLEVGRTMQSAEFACRDGFRHDFRIGIYRKDPDQTKRMSYGNLARQAPGPDGVCKCWPTIEAFLANKESVNTRAKRDMRDMIIPVIST